MQKLETVEDILYPVVQPKYIDINFTYSPILNLSGVKDVLMPF